MDDSLRIIRYLYGDDVDDPVFARRVTEDDELRREYERLQETKAALDRRSASSPDPAVVDRVVERAAAAAQTSDSRVGPSSGRADDRDARAPAREWTRRLQGAGAVLAILLVVGLGWWQWRLDGPTSSATATEPAVSRQTSSATTEGSEVQADDIPEWDDSDEVVRLHRRIEMLRSRSRSGNWGGTLQTAGGP